MASDATYYVSVRESAAGANKRHLTIWNGHASLVLRVYQVRAAGAPTAAVTGLVVPLYVARITSAPTGGSAATIEKADSANANVPGTITAITGATGGATEGGTVGVGTVSGEETSSAMGDDLFTSPIDGSQPLLLRPSEGIVIRQGTLASAGNISIVARVGVA